jgi:hypothetical protein
LSPGAKFRRPRQSCIFDADTPVKNAGIQHVKIAASKDKPSTGGTTAISSVTIQ